MRIRHLLLSTVMCGSVALMSSASWSQTAPKVTYNPQGDWAVTRMAAKGAGKVPYCTMARRFGNNVILTFARNAQDETSVALDFQPKTLAKGQSYYVTLTAGANEKRAFDVTPVSDKAMVIRLGQDPKFHQALSQSGVLNADVAGLQFEYNVPDMAKGDQDLSGCVGSIVEPAAGGVSKPAQTAQADETVVRRAADDILAAPVTSRVVANPPAAVVLSAGGSEMESLREENLRLKNALERERREYEDRFMRESAGSSQVSEVMEKLKLLEKENGDLKYQLADARSMTPKTGAAPKADVPSCVPADPRQGAALSALRDENARLKADIAAQKTAMVQLEMQADQAKADGGKMAADEGVINRMQSRIDELAAQNSKLQSDLTSAQASASAAPAVSAEGSISVAQLRSVEAQLSSVEKERDSLRTQIEKMGTGKEDGLLRLSGSDWNLEQATRRYNEAEREIRRLGSQLEQARTQCSVEKKEIEYMLFDPEIATQQQISKLMTLESEVNAARDALAKKDGEVDARIKGYEQKIAQLEAETQKSRSSDAELAALRNELSVAKQAAAERIAALQGQIQTGKESSTRDLTAQLARANAEKDQMAQRIAALESNKAQLEARTVAAIQPAAGTPRVAVQEMDIASASVMSPQTVQAEPIGEPEPLRPGQVSSRVEPPAPIALAPKSAVPADTFQPTQGVAQAAAPRPVSAPASNLITADVLSGQLRQAGLALTGNVKRVDNISGPAFVAYSWDASGLFGSAEQKPMANAEQFQPMVNQYLDKTKSRCTGDFAVSPVPNMPPPSGIQVASYEIACIGPDGNGSSAALAFYGKDGLFTSVAHESGMDAMDMAMDARDRVLASVVK